MLQNFYRRNFWRQQKCDFRKVWIEKVRFAPRIDIIAQKLAPVTSGEVGEYLHFSSQKHCGDQTEIMKGNADTRQLRLWP